MRKILLAFQFLTIIPVKEIKEVSEKEIGSSSEFLPLVGFVQGLLLVVSAILFLKAFPPGLANGLLILVIVLTNGGLHLDGLADTFDAVAVKSTGNISMDREKRLAVMKDSSIGSIGVIAIVLTILLKYLLLNVLFLNSPPAYRAGRLVTYYLSLSLMPVFSRWAIVPAIFHAKSARQEGFGRIFIENTGLKELVIATLLTILIFLSVLLITHYLPTEQAGSLLITHYLFILPVLYIFSLIAVWFSNRRFGGMTGDTFGAVSEISEILFLLTILALKNYLR